MTVLELKSLIYDLPDDMNVVIPTPGDTYTTACLDQSCIMGMPVDDEQREDGYFFEDVFVIIPCSCHVDIPVAPNPEQNLN